MAERGLMSFERKQSPILVAARQLMGAAVLLVLSGSCAPGKPLESGLNDNPLLVLHLNPDNVSLHPAEAVLFSATGDFANGASGDVGVSWSALGGIITDQGRYIAGSTPGSYQVTATASNGMAATSTVVISTTPPPTPVLARIEIEPGNAAVSTGGTEQFTATGILSDSSESPVSVTWRATNGSITSGGLTTAPSVAGSYLVIATVTGGSLADTARVTVTEGTLFLTGITVSPDTRTLQSSETAQFSAVGRLSSGGTTAIAVTWTATGGTISSSGLYRAGNNAGNFRVIGRSAEGFADTSSVTVTAPTVTALNLTPGSASLSTGQSQQFTTTATLSNGGTQNNPAVTYSATGGTVSGSGLYTAGSTPGTYRVVVSGSGKSDTSAVSIVASNIIALNLTPLIISVEAGEVHQFSVTATLSTGGTLSDPAVTWVATGGTVNSSGLYVAGDLPGIYAVTATCSCGLIAASVVTVLPAGPPPTGSHPNEPDGYTVVTDQPLSSPTAAGWRVDIGSAPIVQDLTGSISPPGALRATYNAGFEAGTAPFSLEHSLPSSKQLFYSLTFKHSTNYQAEASGTNKLGFIWIHGNPSVFLSTEGSGSGNMVATMRLQNVNDSREYLRPNLGRSGIVQRGVWHTWEVELISNTNGQSNGTVRFWLDGVMIGLYTDVQFSTASQSNSWDLSNIFPIWGGVGGRVSNTMTIDFDHIYISEKD